MTSSHRIAVFACVRSTWDQDDVARYAQRAEEVAWALTYQWRLFYLHTDIVVEDPLFDILVDPDPSDHPNYSASAVQAYRDENPDEVFTHYLLLGGDRISGQHPGYGTRGKAVVFDPWAILDLHGHEGAHTLGIGHMGRIAGPGKVADYGGYGCGSLDGMDLPDNNACRYLRLIPPDRVVENASCVLYPIENHPAEAGSNHQLLKLTDSETNEFYIAWRQWHGKARVGRSHALIVDARYRRPIETGKTKTIALDALPVGEERLIGDHWVKFDEIREGAARVKVRHKGDASYEPCPVQIAGFARPTVHLDLTSAHTGLWYHPVLSGQGFDVLIRDGRCVLGWYTFDERAGQQRWYSMQGDVAHGVAALDIYRNTQTYGREHIGEAQLAVLNDEQLLLQYNTTVHGRRSLALRCTHPAREAQWDVLTGAWHDPTLDGEGLRVVCLGAHAAAYYYGYGAAEPPPPYQPPDSYSSQRWWHYNLLRVHPQRFEGPEYRVRNGLFEYPGTGPLEELGRAYLTVLTPNRVRFVSPGHTRELVRLF